MGLSQLLPLFEAVYRESEVFREYEKLNLKWLYEGFKDLSEQCEFLDEQDLSNPQFTSEMATRAFMGKVKVFCDSNITGFGLHSVPKADYYPKLNKIVVTVSKEFLISVRDAFEETRNAFKDIVSHELNHKQQNQNNSFEKHENPRPPTLDDIYNNRQTAQVLLKKYIRNKQEADSFARQMVSKFSRYYPPKLFQMLTNSDWKGLENTLGTHDFDILKTYHDYCISNNNTNLWRRFIKRLVQFTQMEWIQ